MKLRIKTNKREQYWKCWCVSLSGGVHFVQYQLIFTENIYIKMDLSAEWMNSFSHFARTVNACSGKLDAYRTGSHPEQKS